jgi:signal transduction histidine kinase
MKTPQSIRILVVDDNEASRYGVVRPLQRAGYIVVEAVTGGEAMREIEQHPDLIIMDVQLPDANGLELSRMVRKNPITSSIPILQISATFTESADRARGLDAGADSYLSGPIEPDELLANVRMLLRLRHAQQALAETNERLQRHIQQLEAAQADLAVARDQLSSQNEALEARVRERTAKLQQTIHDLETFSYSITHDMRAPLRAMQGFSKMLLEQYGAKLDAEGAEFLQRIAGAANRLDLLIRDVLSYSNIVRAELTLVPVDLDLLIRDILRDYPDLHPPKAQIHIVDKLPPALGNEAFLTQIFSNLLGNAVKFVAPGVTPNVEVSHGRQDGFLRVKIRDNGIGIASPHQEGIFKLFHRAQNSYPGTGIGLAVVHKAVERLGGRVGLESEPGKGSTFWVDLREAQKS